MTKRIDRYLFGLIIVPLFGTLVVAAMLLVLDRMLRLFDFVINEGGPVNVVWRMLGNLLPEYLSLGIPIGVMLGILLAFRRLAMSSELDTMLAVGVSYKRLLRVPFVFATGYGESFRIPPELGAVPLVRKPYTADTLRRVLATGRA